MVGTRSLSSGARSRDPLALPTLQIIPAAYFATISGNLPAGGEARRLNRLLIDAGMIKGL